MASSLAMAPSVRQRALAKSGSSHVLLCRTESLYPDCDTSQTLHSHALTFKNDDLGCRVTAYKETKVPSSYIYLNSSRVLLLLRCC